MTDLEETLTPLVRRTISDVLQAEGLVTEAMRELVKDEIKDYMRVKLNEDPELKRRSRTPSTCTWRRAPRELIAAVKLTKAGAKLSFNMIPPHLREELKGELIKMFEKELNELLLKV